jgi:hypothetical protein
VLLPLFPSDAATAITTAAAASLLLLLLGAFRADAADGMSL